MQAANLTAEGSGGDPQPSEASADTQSEAGAGRRWQRPLIALGIAALVTLLLSLLPQDNAAEGWVTDRLVASRAQLMGTRPLSESEHVLVIGVDQRSLDSPELETIPRVMFSPVYRELITKALDHGAKGVALDFILTFDAGKMEKYQPPVAQEARPGDTLVF